MSYFADHLAWQQRVNQEFKAQSSTLDSNMYQNNGQWFNYPDLINYLKTQQMEQGVSANQRKFGEQNIPMIAAQMSKLQGVKDDSSSNFGYTGKSKLIYQRKSGGSQRSKTGSKYSGLQRFNEAADAYGGDGGETRSKLSKAGLQRFNEELPPNQGPISSTKKSGITGLKSIKMSVKSKPVSQIALSQKSKPLSQVSIRQPLAQKQTLPIQQDPALVSLEQVEVQQPEMAQQVVAEEQNIMEEINDQVNEMPEQLESASQVKPTQSQISQMSGKTYISQLQRQLNEERDARMKLEGELEDLKKISSEITSHLSLIQKQQEEEKLAAEKEASEAAN